VKEEDIHQCINNGIRKINVGTELLVGWTRKANEMFSQTKENTSIRKFHCQLEKASPFYGKTISSYL
jgi:fructose/tagatose bisphosphate aldolase